MPSTELTAATADDAARFMEALQRRQRHDESGITERISSVVKYQRDAG